MCVAFLCVSPWMTWRLSRVLFSSWDPEGLHQAILPLALLDVLPGGLVLVHFVLLNLLRRPALHQHQQALATLCSTRRAHPPVRRVRQTMVLSMRLVLAAIGAESMAHATLCRLRTFSGRCLTIADCGARIVSVVGGHASRNPTASPSSLFG